MSGRLPRRFPGLWERRTKLDKQKKEQVIGELKEKFLRAKGVVFTDYKGMTVAELSELRRSLDGARIEYRVVKNTLARKASEGTPVSAAGKSFVGPVGAAIGYDDAATVAKSILEYSKKNPKLKVMGGVIEKSYCGPVELKAVADLPSRDVMLSVMAGTFQAPLSKMAQLLAATVQSFGYALTAVKDKKAAAGGN